MFTRVRAAKVTGVLGEIAMLVVGINIALWFEGRFDDMKDAATEQQYLQGLREDLATDIRRLDDLIEFNRKKAEALERSIPALPGLADAPPDDQASAVFEPAGYQFFRPSDFTYRSMQESGDFRLLSDADTKQALLRLMRIYDDIEQLQQNYLQALDAEYIPLMMRSFDIASLRVTDASILENQLFRNFFAFALNETSQRHERVQRAREQALALLESIEGQLAND